MGIDNCCECEGGSCSRIQCIAIAPFNGFAPFPSWAQGSATYTNGDDFATRTAFLARADLAFDSTSSLGTVNPRARSSQATLNENATTRYLGFAATYDTWIRDPIDLDLQSWGVTWAESRHPKSKFTGIDGGNDRSVLSTIVSSSANVTTGVNWSESITDGGVLTSFGSGGEITPPTPIIHGDLVGLVDTYAGASISVEINATSARLTLFLPEAAVETILTVDAPGDVEVVCTMGLSDPHDLEESLSNAVELLDIFELDNLAKTYGAYGFGSVLSFGNRYHSYYEGPASGVPLAATIIEDATANNFPWAAREWIGTGGVPGSPVPYELDFTVGGLGESVVRCAKALGSRTGQAATLYSEEWTLPRPTASEGEYTLGGFQGTYGGVTDCIHWNQIDGDIIDLADLIFDFGRATMQRDCNSDSLCTP